MALVLHPSPVHPYPPPTTLTASPLDPEIHLDEAILPVLPPNSRIISLTPHGTSTWTLTQKLVFQPPSSSPLTLFLKTATGDDARLGLKGEYHAMLTLHTACPSFAPKPYAWGVCKAPDTYFLLISFVELTGGLPDAKSFCSQLAKVHKTPSPTGKFGFHIPTSLGRLSQCVNWDPNWCSYLTQHFRSNLLLAEKTQRLPPHFPRLAHRVIEFVIPRLLSSLAITPVLIHGDLWYGNTGVNAATGEAVMFDAACSYAHHEFDLAMWGCERHEGMEEMYLEEYFKYMEKSEPKEEFEDRNRLYRVVVDLVCVVGTRNEGYAEEVRRLVESDMEVLVEKYAPFEDAEVRGEGGVDSGIVL
ncbi:hypothetical protein M011DRAFT_459009 [Sporormia fimetaria CBS 119925]|uniref:protein-ribulosamine 3-kinase n=1 Tax=Sporormia fimetaria CBS 119925 TaxID=1340428 RepID=A0A6A6VAM9_9PLEO|nr:hypothetical protein M011DRAFT_459009 [Sporormia fimetaria CBS 119925]